jgi:hypothetical protein
MGWMIVPIGMIYTKYSSMRIFPWNMKTYVYQNIKKSGIYDFVARPTLFPIMICEVGILPLR